MGRRSHLRPRVRCGALASALAGALACAAPVGERTVYPALPTPGEAVAGGYEIPPVLSARDLLPASLREGAHHEIADDVVSDGFVHVYTIRSDFGEFEARGDDMLHTRIREIRALAALKKMSGTEAFAQALAQALSSPFVATWNLVTSPVDTISGIPASAWRTLRQTAALTTGERGELEGPALGELIGFEGVKRELAHQLGVDPYSSNRVLQRALNRFAWVSYAGGLPGRLVPFGAGATRVQTVGFATTERLAEILLHYSPEDLGRLNRIELAVMGVPGPSRDAFIGHRWYSPRHETILVASLSALDLAADRAAFVDAALSAESEDDALFYQHVAEMLRAYHEHAEPLVRIVPVGRVVAALSAGGTLVVPFPADYAVWTEPTHRFAAELHAALPPGVDAAATEILVSGTLSPRARGELEGLGFRVTDRIVERLSAGLPPGDPTAPARGDPAAAPVGEPAGS